MFQICNSRNTKCAIWIGFPKAGHIFAGKEMLLFS